MYKCNTWVSKSDSLPFIPNKIKQREEVVETRRSSTENNGKRPDARYLGRRELLARIWARLLLLYKKSFFY